MMRRILSALCLAVCLVGYPSPAPALEWLDDTVETLEENLDEGSVMGGGILYAQRPYKGLDDDVYPVPIVMMEYKRIFIDQSLFGFNFIDDEELKISVVAGPHFGGYNSSDSDDLAGMEDREWSFDGGLGLKWDNEWFTFTATGLADLMSEYDGQEASLVVSKKLFEGFLMPRVGAVWSSEDAVDYYFGVRSSEARSGRPAYAGDATFNCLLGLTVAVPMGEKWAAIGDFQYQFLGDEITDSPIVEEDGLFRLTLGAVYRF